MYQNRREGTPMSSLIETTFVLESRNKNDSTLSAEWYCILYTVHTNTPEYCSELPTGALVSFSIFIVAFGFLGQMSAQLMTTVGFLLVFLFYNSLCVNPADFLYLTYTIQRQCHQIFDPVFFMILTQHGPLIQILKYFCIRF